MNLTQTAAVIKMLSAEPYRSATLCVLSYYQLWWNNAVSYNFGIPKLLFGARGSAVGWGTALQVVRLRVRFPDGIIGIFRLHNASGPGVDSAPNRNEYQEYFLVG